MKKQTYKNHKRFAKFSQRFFGKISNRFPKCAIKLISNKLSIAALYELPSHTRWSKSNSLILHVFLVFKPGRDFLIILYKKKYPTDQTGAQRISSSPLTLIQVLFFGVSETRSIQIWCIQNNTFREITGSVVNFGITYSGTRRTNTS